jgi:Serine carboxypeptidase
MRCCAAGGVQGSKYDPCVDDEVTAYLNRDDVQEALHVPLPHRPHVRYAICSNEVQYSRSEFPIIYYRVPDEISGPSKKGPSYLHSKAAGTGNCCASMLGWH